MCLPYLKCLDLLPETHLFFYLALPVVSDRQCLVVSSTPEEWFLKLDKRPPANGVFMRHDFVVLRDTNQNFSSAASWVPKIK